MVTWSGLIPPGARVLVAFSGGADSTALLLALRELEVDVVAAHFDHSLRAGSAADATAVAETCASLGVPLVVERRAGALPPGSLQAAAREARYRFLENARTRARCDLVALAHTADDRVEGVLLNLLRGTGVAGLQGMPRRRGVFVRPLLDATRADVEAYVARTGRSWIEDPSNRDRAFARVAVRRDLLPELERRKPGITPRLRAIAARAEVAQHALGEQARTLAAGRSAGIVAMMAAPAPVRRETLRRMYAAAGGSLPGLSRRQLLAMETLLQLKRPGASLDLPGGFRFLVGYTEVEVSPYQPPATTVYRLQARHCHGCGDSAAIHLNANAKPRVGYRRPGLRMRPAGGSGTRKLQDILVDARIPRGARDRLPLVFDGDRLAWVPGVAAAANLVVPAGEEGLHVTLFEVKTMARKPKNPMVDSTNHRQGVIPL